MENLKVYNQKNLWEFSLAMKAMEKHILEGGTIILPEVKGRYDVSKKFASSTKKIAHSYLVEFPKEMEKEVIDPLTAPWIILFVQPE